MSYLKDPPTILMRLHFLTFGNVCDMRRFSLMKNTIHLSGGSGSNPETAVALRRCFLSFDIFISHILFRFYNFTFWEWEKRKKLHNFYFLYLFQLHFSSDTIIKNSFKKKCYKLKTTSTVH